MLFVDNAGHTDPRLNLALEEHVLRRADVADDLLLFYVNAPSIIIGRNQNTIEEIDPDVVAARGVRVVRRISGGGAVYHDFGNLNFSFVTAHTPERFNRFESFVGPVVDVMRDMGVAASLGGRNDVVGPDGRKLSGNAQFTTTARMFSHGTVLVDSDLDAVAAALRPKPGKVESKGVKSVRSRVANLNEYLATPTTVDELRGRILERLFGTRAPHRLPTLPLGADDWAAVRALADRKYGAWSWTYGEDPPSDVARARRFPAGEIDVRLGLAGGRVTAARFYGDFMGREDAAELAARLVGVPYERAALAHALARVDVRAYFGDVRTEDVLDVIVG